jgi:hypothetical protein
MVMARLRFWTERSILRLGVLLLELVTSQCSEEGGADIIQWVQGSRFACSMHKMIDPDLGN